MKVITKCVIDMNTLQVIEEESFQYEGPIAEYKGGGSSSGQSDWPAYMKDFHTALLDAGGGDLPISLSLVELMDVALGGSPWAAATAYDPDADITAYEAAVAGFAAILAGINETTEWAALYTQAVASIDVAGITDAEIVADSAAFGASLDDQITTTVLPRFQSGMRDINAVVSSAFPIGQAVIEGFRDRDVAKHESALRVAAELKNADIDLGVARARLFATDQMTRFLLSKYAWNEDYMKAVIEGRRIKIVAKGEEADGNQAIGESDALWDLNVYSHAGNFLASIGSGVSAKPKKSRLSSAIGGALTMGAAAAMMGTGGAGIAGYAALGAAATLLE